MLVIDSRHNPQQGRFSRAVGSQDTNFGPIKVGQADVFENLFAVVDLAHLVH